jgi:hypothetical protein
MLARTPHLLTFALTLTALGSACAEPPLTPEGAERPADRWLDSAPAPPPEGTGGPRDAAHDAWLAVGSQASCGGKPKAGLAGNCHDLAVPTLSPETMLEGALAAHHPEFGPGSSELVGHLKETKDCDSCHTLTPSD